MSTLTFNNRRRAIRTRRRVAVALALTAVIAVVVYAILASATNAQQAPRRAAAHGRTAVHAYITKAKDGSTVVTGYDGGVSLTGQ
jgi:drug/metabolite transporter superfamily protein YnfA